MFGFRVLGFGAFPNRDVTFSVANGAVSTTMIATILPE